MRERPILFSAPMVRALLAGRKTQTRRIVKVQPRADDERPEFVDSQLYFYASGLHVHCPYGVPGDRLWVREAWAVGKGYDGLPGSKVSSADYVRRWYMADGLAPDWAGRVRTSRFMPRWASRITLEVQEVRAQELHNIDERDALAEGMVVGAVHPCDQFAELWDSINGAGSWKENPYVWAVSFRPVLDRPKAEQ